MIHYLRAVQTETKLLRFQVFAYSLAPQEEVSVFLAGVLEKIDAILLMQETILREAESRTKLLKALKPPSVAVGTFGAKP